MAVDSSLVLPGRIAQERSGDHRFFTGMALASALTVFIGFARTYYLRSVFDGPPPLAFLSVPLGTLLAFLVLVSAGLLNRRHPETHKRLMLLATIALITPAIARFRFFLPGGPLLAIVGTTLFVLACLVWDRAAHGRIHPAFLWGGLFLIVSLPVRFAIGRTAAWAPVAEWLTR